MPLRIVPIRVVPGALVALALSLPWLASFPGHAGAQVAVPTLVPVSPTLTGATGTLSAGFVTLNPAAMQWGSPSRVGLGRTEGKIEREDFDNTELRGWFGGARLVGLRWSIAGEGVSLRDTSGPLDFAIDTATGALGVRALQSLTLGLGYSSEDNRQGLIDSNLSSWTGGGSYRLGDWLFIGGVYGQDHAELKDESIPAAVIEFEENRPFWLAGVGIRWGGRLRVHLEYYLTDRAPYKHQGAKFGDVESQVGVAELGLGPFVLGFQAISIDEEQGGGRYKTNARVYDLALAPLLGLAIGARLEQTDEKDEASGLTSQTRLTAVTLAYQF